MQLGALLCLWLHLLAVAVWVGGMVFLAAVLIPTVREPEHRALAARLITRSGYRFRRVGWICVLLIIASGLGNLWFAGFGWRSLTSGAFWTAPYGHTLAVKLALVGLILVISLAHDFLLGPRAAAAMQEAPDSERARRLRRTASWIGRTTLLLALVVVFLGLSLSRPW